MSGEIVAIVRKSATDAVADEALRAARAAATSFDGVVVASEEQATIVTDALGSVKKGLKRLETLNKGVLEPVREMERAIAEVFGPIAAQLERAKKLGNDALLAWDTTKARRVKAEEERRLQEAAEAARSAREEADMLGEPAPPPMDPLPVLVPRMTRGGASSSYVSKRVAVAMVDPYACDPTWLDLKPVARSEAELAVKKGDIELPDTAIDEASGVRWRGLTVWNKRTVVNK